MLTDRQLDLILRGAPLVAVFAAYCHFRGRSVFGVPARRRALRAILDDLRGYAAGDV